MKRKIALLLLAMFLIFSFSSFSTTYYVNGFIGDDQNNGLYPIPTTAFNGPKKTISAALVLVQAFDTVIIASGIYREYLTIDSVMVMIGAGSGTDSLSNTIIKCPGVNTGTGITVASAGADSLNRLKIMDLRVDGYQYGIMLASHSTYVNVSAVNNSVYGFYLPSGQVTDMKQILCEASYNTQGGFYIGHSADVDGWLIDSCLLEGNNFSGLYIFCDNPSTGTVKNFIFRNSILRKNFQKGLYIEKLQDALFENLVIDSCGYNPGYNFNTGMDINLKFNNYSNIVIRYCDFINCGLGGSNLFGCGLIVKGRDDGATYGANPATLDNVQISNIKVNGCLSGIIVGEPNASNATPTNVSVQLSDLSGNVLHNFVSEIKSDVDAHNNWWGLNAQPDTAFIAQNDTGEVMVYTFLENGSNIWPSPGFYPWALFTFDPNIHTLEEAITVASQTNALKIPTFNYQGLTEINNSAALMFCDNVVIEDILLDSLASVVVGPPDTGFAISSSITLKNGSWLNGTNGEGIELYPSATISEASRSVIQGKVYTERIISTSGASENFGGLGIEIIASNSSPFPGNVLVKRYTDIFQMNNPTKVLREFDVIAQNNQGLDATLKYIYDDSEIDSIGSESALTLFRSMDNGISWVLEGGFLDIANNSITVTGLDSITGLWAAFDSTGYSAIFNIEWENNIQLFPNPSADGFFTIIADAPFIIGIFDQTARLISTEKVDNHGRIMKKINLSQMPKGMYYLEMKSLKGQKVFRKMIID